MRLYLQNKNILAFGLLESLVAIAVFGVSIILGLNLVVQSLRIIKDNQIADESSSFMVSTLEFVKSPTLDPSVLSIGNYSLDYDTVIKNIVPQTTELIETCDSTSVYYINLESENAPLMCSSIKVELVDNTNPNSDYLITSKVVYRLSDEFVIREIRGFKQRSL